MKPIRVLHLISSLAAGGAQTMLANLLTQMDRQRFQNQVVSLIEIGAVGAQLRATGFPVYSLGMRRGQPSPTGLLRFVRLLRQERPAILQTWLYHADLLGLIAGRLAGTPHTLWNLRAAYMDMRQYRRLSGWTLRACAMLSAWPSAAIVNSEAGRAFHAQLGYRPRRWVLIPNGFDTETLKPDAAARLEVRQELGLGPEAMLIGLVARFDPMKDHATFVRATDQLARKAPDVHFVLVGEGVTVDNPALSALIAQAQLVGRAHLLGRRSDIPWLTAALDIATCSSYGEGFPNAVGEAMACGVPCVVTDVGDAARIVGETGIVVPPKDPVALAEGWRKLIALGMDGRGQLGQAARLRIQQHYSLTGVVRQYEDLYESVTEETRCAV
jgi:glycosyltransferase involved in cell wall biosynthesis